MTSPPLWRRSRGSMRSILGAVDRFFDLVLGFLDHLFDLVLRVAGLLLGLASLTIRLAFVLKLLVANQTSRRLFCLTLDLRSNGDAC